MSLRVRLLGAILLALLISLGLGAGLAAWEAARAVHAELVSALANARQGTAAALADLPPGATGEAELRRMVQAYDGSRHVRVTLIGADGAALARSLPLTGRQPPGWFLRLVDPTLPPILSRVNSVPGIVGLRLEADPENEASERWHEMQGRLTGLAIFFAVAVSLGGVIVTTSLRPLTGLAEALARVGGGETSVHVPANGPREVARLAAAFNEMAAALRAAEAQNRRLADQVASIAEEERAQIARDLHDEIGPVLFAITAFTAAIGRQVQTGDLSQVPAQLAAIREATQRLQREVRDMLGRLQSERQAPARLRDALEELMSFWRGVRPETEFTVACDIVDATLSEMARDCLFRAAQEGVSNAVRHGRPAHVAIEAHTAPQAVTLLVRDDGNGGAPGVGLGLAGMRARAASLGGSVDINTDAGWVITVRLPLQTAAPAGQAA